MQLSRPSVPSGKPDWVARSWIVLLLAALCCGLLPLDPYSPVASPGLSVAGFPRGLAQQFYQVIKSSMLWVPLGALLAYAGQERRLMLAASVVVPGMLLVGLPLLPDARVADALDVVFAVPGLALGLWLGKGTIRRGERDKARRPAAKSVLDATVAGLSNSKASALSLPTSPASGGGREGEGPHADIAAGKSSTTHLAGPVGLLFGVGVLAVVALALWGFPRWPVVLGLALVLYAVALWLRPLAWLVVVPAALPLLDLAPWTGRTLLDEFDLLMLATLGVLALRRAPAAPRALQAWQWLLLGLFALSTLAALAMGLLPFAAVDTNAFSSYWSTWNALRVAKGFVWGGLLFLWLRHAAAERAVLARLLSLGMGLGLLGVGLVGAWEHHLFVGFEDRLETYRIVGTFSSMHTGGGHIEAYLVAALPFLWLATSKMRHALLTGPVLLLAAYVMVYTVARGGVLALAVVLVILGVASARLAYRAHGRRFLAPFAALLAVALVLAAGAGGTYFQKRFGESGKDWQTRVDHWGRAIDMAGDGFMAGAFGNGLGSFPRRHLERGPADNQPATFGFAVEQGNPYFRLGSGATVYYAQRIPFEAGRNYRLELDVRSRQGDTRLDTPVCEKQLLNSRQCEWSSFDVPGDGQWHRLNKTISSAQVGKENWLNRPPVELFFYHPGKSGVVDIDNVRLLGPDGRDVLCNGDFRAGGDCWFFKTHSHLPWHIKNVWVHVWFEQGWLGLLAFAGLTLAAVVRLAREGWRGHRLAWAWLASLAGLLTVGMFDSLLDAPRLATLLVALLLLGVGYDWRAPSNAKRRRRGGDGSNRGTD